MGVRHCRIVVGSFSVFLCGDGERRELRGVLVGVCLCVSSVLFCPLVSVIEFLSCSLGLSSICGLLREL